MSTEHQFETYKRRWYVLAIVSALTISNQQIWCSFSSVASIAAQYYNVSVSKINILSMVYFICTFPFGIFALWFTDYVGLNKAVWIGAWCNAIGATIQLISTTSIVSKDDRFNVTLAGQIIAGLGQMYLYVPTKVAELWFPENERTLASSLIALATPCGIMLGVGLMPLIITKPDDIPIMVLVACVFAVTSAIINCGFTSSRPPTPPSATAESNDDQKNFCKALKELFTNKPYILLLAFGGAIIGIAAVFCTLLGGILSPRGYSNKFAGLCVVLMISFGTIGGIVSGVLMDKLKVFTPVAKIAGGLGVMIFAIYSMVVTYSGLQYEIGFLSVALGTVVLMSYTALLELTVECTFPLVPEATSTGILFIFGQLHGTVYFLILDKLATTADVGGVTIVDMKRSILIVAGIITALYVVFVILFRTEYKRTNKELSSGVKITDKLTLQNEEGVLPVSYRTINNDE